MRSLPYEGGFLLPPRPEKAVPVGMLRMYERRGWVAQAKKNGTCSVVTIEDGRVSSLTRHGTAHKAWGWSKRTRALFRDRFPTGTHVLVCELLHSKVSDGPRHTHYINDIIVHDGQHLVGSKFKQRMKLLKRLLLTDDAVKRPGYWRLEKGLWLARCYDPEKTDFRKLYRKLDKPEDEGLVLKNPEARLTMKQNGRWQVKCRRRHKNYGF